LPSRKRKVDAHFAMKLKEFRKERGLTQQEVADALGVFKSTISKWELCQREASLSTIKAICKIYGVEPGYFVNFDYNEEEKGEGNCD